MSKATEACSLGEIVHGAFRIATTCEEAAHIYRLITDMPNREWNAILEYIVDEMPDAVHTAIEEEARRARG